MYWISFLLFPSNTFINMKRAGIHSRSRGISLMRCTGLYFVEVCGSACMLRVGVVYPWVVMSPLSLTTFHCSLKRQMFNTNKWLSQFYCLGVKYIGLTLNHSAHQTVWKWVNVPMIHSQCCFQRPGILCFCMRRGEEKQKRRETGKMMTERESGESQVWGDRNVKRNKEHFSEMGWGGFQNCCIKGIYTTSTVT